MQARNNSAIMDIEHIKTQLDSGNLCLDQSVLGSRGDASLKGLFRLKGPLGLTNLKSVSISTDRRSISFGGCVEIFSLSVAVTCYLFGCTDADRNAIFKFELSAEKYQEYLSKASGVADDSVETMMDLYLPTIAYGSQEMIFSTLGYKDDEEFFNTLYPQDFRAVIPGADVKAGLNFPVTASIESDFCAYIGTLFSGKLTPGVNNGRVYLPPGGDGAFLSPYCLVSCPIQASLSYPLESKSPALQIKFESFGLGFPLVSEDEIWWPEAILSGSVTVCGKGLSFEADYDLYHQFLKLRFLNFPSLKDLLSTFCKPEDLFPEPLNELLEIQLSLLEIGFDLPGKSVTEIGLSLTTENDISLLENIVSIKPTLDLQIQSPFDSEARSLQGTLSGDWMLGTTEFVTSLAYPSFDLHAGMAEGQKLDVDELAKKVFGLDSASLPAVTIESLELNGNLNEKSFAFGLEITSDWTIPLTQKSSLGLTLRQVRMGMSYTDQQRDFGIFGLIQLAGVDINISAQYTDGDFHFEGSTGAGQVIPFGTLVRDFAEKLGEPEQPIPAELSKLSLKNLDISFHTKAKDFTSTGEADYQFSPDKSFALILTTELTHPDGKNKIDLSARFNIVLDDETTLCFDMLFEHGAAADIFIATYHPAGDKQTLDISALVKRIGPEEFVELIQELDIQVEIKSLLFAFIKAAPPPQGSKPRVVFGLDLGAQFTLSNLPLVGKELPQSIGIDHLQFVVASNDFDPGEVNAVNQLLSGQVAKLPDIGASKKSGSGEPGQEKKEPALRSGITLSASLNLGMDKPVPLLLSSGADKGKLAATRGDAPPTTTPAAPSVKWTNIKKTFGSVHFERIGFQYQKGDVWFLLDGSLTVGGLSLSLDGLGLGSSITAFDPKFDLRGLGIDFKAGPVEIGGAFLKTTVNGAYDEYVGKAILRIKAFSLSAIGAYADYSEPNSSEKHASMFIYAVLNYPLGGPSFFFVTGLSAGFGYNRTLKMPAMDEVPTFPLVEEACGTKQASADLGTELKSIQKYVPIQVGEYFLAAGIKFTSFKMIESFAMLAVSFGQHFEIDLLGMSTMIIPLPEKDVPSLAEIQIAFKASFIPDQGFLGLAAQLTSSSFILSKDCHLTGGLAFYCWFAFEHAGDFVLTVGGYHPAVKVPEHYPQVPRLGISWKVDEHLSIKGDAYFALTPSMLMAGGHLEANWNSGALAAWFKAGVDFLIAWKPFHYDAYLYIDMGVSYTFELFGTHHITVELGADLHIWGPEFSGIAHIHLWFITFDVQFGASSSHTPQPIGWDVFESSFLPEPILSVSVKDGLVGKDSSPKTDTSGSTDLGVINPKELSLVVDSVVPVAKSKHTSMPTQGFGIAPMDKKEVQTELTIAITNGKGTTCEQVDFVPITKNVPAGLWGKEFLPAPHSEPLVQGVLTGFEVKGKPPVQGEAVDIQCAKLQYEPVPKNMGLSWGKDLQIPAAQPLDDSARRKDISAGIESSAGRRKDMLAALGLGNETFTLDGKVAADFVVAPQIEATRG